jgi:hypothetical protein
MDGLGVGLNENLLDIEMLYRLDQGGYGPIRFWIKFEPIVREMRERNNNPELLKGFEYYIEEMKKMRKQKGLSSKWSPALNRFVEEDFD